MTWKIKKNCWITNSDWSKLWPDRSISLKYCYQTGTKLAYIHTINLHKLSYSLIQSRVKKPVWLCDYGFFFVSWIHHIEYFHQPHKNDPWSKSSHRGLPPIYPSYREELDTSYNKKKSTFLAVLFGRPTEGGGELPLVRDDTAVWLSASIFTSPTSKPSFSIFILFRVSYRRKILTNRERKERSSGAKNNRWRTESLARSKITQKWKLEKIKDLILA